MRLLVLAIGFFIFLMPVSQASHLAGGEISYTCLGNGDYRFQLVIFRDCSGINFVSTTQTLSGPVQVVCQLVGAYDITSNFNCPGVSCVNPSITTSNKGGMAKFVYEGTVNLNSLPATPVGGYTWHTGALPCCRNSSSNTNCISDMAFQVTMHRFVDASGNVLTPAQLCDNSPRFLEDPHLVVVQSLFDTTVFNGFGEDVDAGDEIRYSITNPLTSISVPCNFIGNYSSSVPMPGLIGNAIDSLTGVIQFVPGTVGNYNMVIRVASYRNGQLLSEVFRDFQLMVISNPPNAPIPYNPIYQPGSPFYDYQQQVPKISGNIVNPVTGLPERTLVLYVGDTMRVDYTVKDSFPTLPVPNRTYAYVRSDQLSATATDPNTGCAEPPCAILQNLSSSTPIGQINLRSRQLGYGLAADSAGFDINGRIFWTPQAVHAQLNGAPAIRKYYFGVFAFDDVCPIVGNNAEFFEVNVLPSTTLLAAPNTLCIAGMENQEVALSWPYLIDTLTLEIGDSLVMGLSRAERLQRSVQRRMASFLRADLYRINLIDSSLNLRASFATPAAATFTDVQVPTDSLYAYSLRIVSSLDTQWMAISLPVIPIRPQISGDRTTMSYQLNWSAPFTPLGNPAGFDGWYYVYSRNLSQQTAWVLEDSVQFTTSLSRPLNLSSDTLAFRVGWKSASACGMNYSYPVQTVFPLNMGIDEQMIRMQLYPNPARTELNIRVEGMQSPKNWRILDMQGRLIREGSWENKAINIDFLPAANYMLILDFGNQRSSRAIFSKED
jgi:hypothetical protein